MHTAKKTRAETLWEPCLFLTVVQRKTKRRFSWIWAEEKPHQKDFTCWGTLSERRKKGAQGMRMEPLISSHYSSRGTLLYVLQHPGWWGHRADICDVRRDIGEVRAHVQRAHVRAMLRLDTIGFREHLRGFLAWAQGRRPRDKSIVGKSQLGQQTRPFSGADVTCVCWERVWREETRVSTHNLSVCKLKHGLDAGD